MKASVQRAHFLEITCYTFAPPPHHSRCASSYASLVGTIGHTPTARTEIANTASERKNWTRTQTESSRPPSGESEKNKHRRQSSRRRHSYPHQMLAATSRPRARFRRVSHARPPVEIRYITRAYIGGMRCQQQDATAQPKNYRRRLSHLSLQGYGPSAPFYRLRAALLQPGPSTTP